MRTELDYGRMGRVCSIDVLKALCPTDQKFSVIKNENYGFKGKMIELKSNFLSERSQVISVNGDQTRQQPITKRVRQRSVFEPFVSLLSIKDLPIVCDNMQVAILADDTTLILSEPKM